MKLRELLSVESATLRSRFGRRLLVLFVVLALVPICTLALVTYWSVTKELQAQGEQRLRNQTKSQTMAVLERLAILERELAMLGSAPSLIPDALSAGDHNETLGPRIKSLAVVDENEVTRLLGSPFSPPQLSEQQRGHLEPGAVLVAFEIDPSNGTRVFMARSLTPLREGRESQGSELRAGAILWGEVDSDYLWWGPYRENNLPALTEMCVLAASSRETLFCSSGEPAVLAAATGSRLMSSALGEFSWNRGGERHRARYRTLLLDRTYGLPGLTVVVSESTKRLSGPLREFRVSFLPIILLTLWVVLLLSVRQIRRSLVPLERLRAGTSGIAASRFSTRVEVESGDEFEELADSFNQMADRLGRQFEALGALTRIQSDVLAAHDQGEIAEAVLGRLDRLLPHREAVLTVLDSPGLECATSYIGSAGELRAAERIDLRSEDLWWADGGSAMQVVESSASLPPFLSHLRRSGYKVAVFPIFVGGALGAILAASVWKSASLLGHELDPLQQLGDQVAQALSKAALIQDLEEQSVGTLAALARAIDASSQWTLGHSERVAKLAVRLGEAMGLSKQELSTLERGALLHDIGKLGVPAAVLDKPSRLTSEEESTIRRHVEIGARILEPVPSLADTMPLIWQHHERVDGKGYPRGLLGSEIHPLAQILSVADVFDALRSARPYRRALDTDEVVQYLKQNSGTQFEPAVVHAFLRVLAEIEAEVDAPDAEEAPIRATL